MQVSSKFQGQYLVDWISSETRLCWNRGISLTARGTEKQKQPSWKIVQQDCWPALYGFHQDFGFMLLEHLPPEYEYVLSGKKVTCFPDLSRELMSLQPL
jgi:hypothetical protein